MALSDAQRKAANKYNAKHMATLGCKVKKEQAAAFREYASDNGKTVNNALKDYVLDCIGETESTAEGAMPEGGQDEEA